MTMFEWLVVGSMGVDEVHNPICTYNEITRDVFWTALKKHEHRMEKLRERVRKYLGK